MKITHIQQMTAMKKIWMPLTKFANDWIDFDRAERMLILMGGN